ncbi:hypothetical protein KKF82_08945, partial [Patescibacteria group bacterium]|nr:hypothetical protein [Patescibacteria group bacterium]
DIISPANGYTAQISYSLYYGEGITFISPTGSDPITEMTCVNVVALLHDGKKYWLTPEIYAGLCYPPWTEIPLSTFHSYPDGTTSILVRGVTIPPRSTASICPTPVEKGIGAGTILGVTILGIGILGAVLFATRKKKQGG